MADLQIAVAGDLHDQWDASDQRLLERLKPDALLLVGDLSDGHSRIACLLRHLDLPLACVLGNHDTGKDDSGGRLRRQLDLLEERHCGWALRQLTPPGLAVVGARPGAAGGGFHVSRAVRAVYGPLSLRESADRITRAALAADPSLPLLLLAHCGPSGLGSEAADPCGRDWTRPACDWGDLDLALAIDQIRRQRPLPLVVFGHMHHRLRQGRGERRTLARDRKGTLYFNCASVPRHGHDTQGRELRHFSWIRLRDGVPVALSHRWFGLAGELLYEEVVWSEQPAPLAEPGAGDATPATGPATKPAAEGCGEGCGEGGCLMLIYVCLSSHGYGHGSRTTAVLGELASLRPGWRLVLSTTLPDAFLALAMGTTVVERRRCGWDVGVAQADALGVDAEATLAALAALEDQLPAQLEREAQWLARQGQPALVLADIAPAAALLAERLDLPLVWLGNFGWDAIYGAMGPAFAGWSQRCLEQYRRGQLRLECPMRLPMPWEQPALQLGLTAARPRLPLAALAEQLRLPDERWRVVVVTFGGLGLRLDPALYSLWPEHVFVGPDPALDGVVNGRCLPQGVRPLDVMPLAERLLTKPGYSSFCEAMSQQVGIQLVPRQGFAEAPMLEQALLDHGWNRLLDAEAFRRGAWELDQPLQAPRLGPLPVNGAAQAARAIAACAEDRSAIPIGAAVGFGNAVQ